MPDSTDSMVNIFLSHKSEDKELAEQLKSYLLEPNSSNLSVFVSSLDIMGGEPWLKKIRNQLRKSKLLLLLFTGHSKDWDWPLYEAGLFTDLTKDDESNVICLNCLSDEDKKRYRDQLTPLADLQQFSTSKEDVAKFVTQLYIETKLTGLNFALAPGLSKNLKQFTELVNGISSLLNLQPVETHLFGHHERSGT